MNETPTPSYWLKVKEEYVIGNFENVLNYLKFFYFNSQQINSDYTATLDCMSEMCASLGDLIRDTPLYRPLQLPYDSETCIKLFCATILSAHSAGRPVNSLIIDLSLLIVHLDLKIDLYKIYHIIIRNLQKAQLRHIGFSWDTILPKSGEFNLNFLLLQMLNMSFREDEDMMTQYLESKGMFLLPGQSDILPVISTENLSDFEKGKCDLQFILKNTISIYNGKGEYSDAESLAELAQVARRLYSRQNAMRPSPKVISKVYTADDKFVVRVTYKYEKLIVAETIDGSYTPIKGKVYINFDKDRADVRTFMSMIEVGSYIPVYRSKEPDFEFETFDSFEDFYREMASDYADTEVEAIYAGYYPTGTKWISREGLHLSLPSEKLKELENSDKFNHAMESGRPLTLKLYKNPPAMDAVNFNVYCQFPDSYRYSHSDNISAFTQVEADREILAAFLEQGAEMAGKIPVRNSYSAIQSEDVRALVPILHKLGLSVSGDLRLWYLFDTAAAMTATITGLAEYCEYLISEQDYIQTLAQFAANSDMRSFTPPAKFAELPEIGLRCEIINSLAAYEKPDNSRRSAERGIHGIDTEEDITAKIKALITASNSLKEIIDISELDNIKRAIVRLLGANDDYISILDNRTFYGRENITLEFKPSAVYTPENLRSNPAQPFEPSMQRWVLLKAVCGFLNSRAGGDLLIGVNDAGYAVGLEEDIAELYRAKLIAQPDIDHLRTYIQNLMDRAFAEKGGKASASDIARTHIEVEATTNSENRTILRVHVRPYRNKIIQLAESPRPAWVADSYVRKEGRTERITPVLEKYVLAYK